MTLHWNTSNVTGEMEEEAIVHFDGDSQPVATLLVKAVVKPPLELLPFPAIFLSAFQGEKNERRLRIVNNEEKPVAISDRKSTRLNSSHRCISYAVFCLKKKKK